MLFRDGLENYGYIIIVANWVPGIVASMHILHMFRTKLPAKKTLLYTGRIFFTSQANELSLKLFIK